MLACCFAKASSGFAKSAEAKLDFNRDIRPILTDNCLSCHGFDEATRKAKLRLDTREGAIQSRDPHPAITPGDLEKSELWHRIITKDEDDLMPPPESNKKLTPQQIETIRTWILQGAEYKGHWAFEKPEKPATPKIKEKRWAKNEVDHFIAAQLEQKKLKPESEASKERLIRRVTFDLTGLPPTPGEVDAFLADKRPGAYERLVERLLSSPRYGEHQARYWLDAVRYGDTHGLHLDNERSMWPYRDWVVKAFNENLPFDEFTIWQLAGDLLPNATREQKIASGYNRNNVTTSEGGSIDDEYYVRYAVDRTETTATIWMGLTAGCAACHDHKFDPISQKEFYSLYAFFNNNKEKAMDGNIALTPPMLKLPTEEEQKQLDDYDKQMADLKAEADAILPTVKYKDPGPFRLERLPEPTELVWIDDDLPEGVKASKNDGTPDLQWVSDAPEGFSGSKAIKRTAEGLAQDTFEKFPAPLIVTKGDKLFAYVYMDPANPPKALMLQFRTTDWTHRANWGDEDAIPYGEKRRGQKTLLGELPKAGEWVRLEVDTEMLEVQTGLRITGVALTQFGGTVYWDKVGAVVSLVQKDRSSESQWAWEVHQKAERSALPAEILKIIRAKERTEEEKQQVTNYYLRHVHGTTRELFAAVNKKSDAVKKKRDDLYNKIPATLVFEEMEKPRGAFVLTRGEYDQRGEEVFANTPAFLPPLPPSEKTNRLTLAKWLIDPEHPLTARVTVNRLWQQYFGNGLVKTSQDFGSQGDWPTNPELLDYLAVRFVEDGWDMKAFHRMIVTSAAYRQDSVVAPKKLEIDPENLMVSRGPRFRLDAEMIRDTALYVGGILNETMGGRGVRPYQPEGIWEAVGYTGSNTYKYTQDKGDALYRRSLYTFWKRTAPHPAMTTFDAPSREKFCVRRERTNTPLQALVTMNDPQFVEAA
ncbi:MAG: PSD1 and planctomycete cytochrome C domain-containing protein, partial [Limisphaerales bacterium]